jgi:CHAD domain-containing protein/CYTH domain-containing protein
VTLPTDLYDQPAPAGARHLARHRLAEARAAAERLRDPFDTEGLHDFRVALRRLRSMMRSYGEQLEDTVARKRRRQLRDVARATNEARDTEVHVAWLREVRPQVTARERAGVDWLVTRLERRQESEVSDLRGATLKAFGKVAQTLESELERWHEVHYLDDPRQPPSMAQFTGDLIRHAVTELEDCLSEVRGVEDETRSHAARIAGKRLRYLIEPVVDVMDDGAMLVKRLKGLQDLFGDLHDAQVFSRELVSASADAGAEAARTESNAVLEGGSRGTRKRASSRDPRAGLLALAERVRDRGQEAWQQASEEWLDGRAAPFLDDCRQLASHLEAHGADTVEIERKYLLSGLPASVEGNPSAELWQGYVPGRRLIERVRRVRDDDGERYYRTIKGGRGVHRIEVEEETSREIFETLWALTSGHRVHKRRWFVPGTLHTWEIDSFLDDRHLWLAEVELASEEEAVEIPEWLEPYVVREVTLEPEYGNVALAK